jgi:hypothetical protein
MRRDELPPHKTATYVMPHYKAVYVSVPKAACTSLKWLVADLQGESAEHFARSLSREVSRAMCIHRRSMWQRTPMLHELSDEELAEISPENGWFVFTVVRHPSARLFSGWQSKFLLREPRWEHDMGDASWFPRVPTTTQDVVEDFARFVLAIEADRDGVVLRDRHFRPQVGLIAADRVPYSRVYGTRDIGQLLADFDTHLRGQGWEGTLQLRRSNETPLAPVAPLFTPEVTDAIQGLYGADFEAFGYADVLPDGLDRDGQYPDRAFAEIERLIERSERIGDLAMRAQALRAAQSGAKKKQRRAKRAVAALGPGAPSSPLRRAMRRVQRKLG